MQGLTNSCIMQPSSKVTYKNRLLVAKSPATRFVKNSPTWTTLVSKSGTRGIIPPRIAQTGLLYRVGAWTARSDGRQTDIRHQTSPYPCPGSNPPCWTQGFLSAQILPSRLPAETLQRCLLVLSEAFSLHLSLGWFKHLLWWKHIAQSKLSAEQQRHFPC